jgi:hypothetical protein
VAILIGFAVATVLVFGWYYRNMLAYVFLTLGMLGVAALTILIGGQVAALGVVTGAAAFCVIWTLRYYRRHPIKAAMRSCGAEPWEPLPGMVKRQCPD